MLVTVPKSVKGMYVSKFKKVFMIDPLILPSKTYQKYPFFSSKWQKIITFLRFTYQNLLTPHSLYNVLNFLSFFGGFPYPFEVIPDKINIMSVSGLLFKNDMLRHYFRFQ